MKAIIIFCFLLFTSCASLNGSLYEARRSCTQLMYEKNIKLKKGEDTSLKQKAYTDCVAQTANANANVSVANATWASVITIWVTTGLSILAGVVRAP